MTENSNEPITDEGGKTFTQDDLNRIVSKRLTEEKTKSEAEFSKREQELNAREFRISAKEKLKAHDMPESLLDALNIADEETLDKSIKAIKEYADSKIKVETKSVGNGVASGGSPLSVDSRIRAAMGLQR